MKKVSIILIIIGILLIITPPIGQFYTRYNEDKMISQWSESEASTNQEVTSSVSNPEEDYKQLQEAFKAESDSQPTSKNTTILNTPRATTTPKATPGSTPKATPKPAKPRSNQVILGIIKIAKIKVKTVIVEGTKPGNLNSGIGHIKGTSQIGQPGNCALAGHRSHVFGRYFNRLDELVVGDEILISTKKSDYKYLVYQKLVVKPDDVSVLKGSMDDNIITLITCTPTFFPTHRLIILARLEGQKEIYHP